MVSAKVWTTINVSLGLISLLLILNLTGVELPSLGQAQYALDKEDPVCIVNWQDNFNQWNDLDRCCLEAKKQLDCHRESLDDLDWVCQSGNELKYWMNNKAFNYCKQLRIW